MTAMNIMLMDFVFSSDDQIILMEGKHLKMNNNDGTTYFTPRPYTERSDGKTAYGQRLGIFPKIGEIITNNLVIVQLVGACSQ